MRYLTLLSGIVLLSLTGLIAIQVSWLNRAIETNEQLFLQKIDLGTKKAGDLYRNRPGMPQLIHKAITASPANTALINQEMTLLINTAFNEIGLPFRYTFGIFKHTDTEQNIRLAGNSELSYLNESLCSQDIDKAFGWTSLTCKLGYGEDNAYHLAIFPSYNAFILNEVKGTLLTAIIFIILAVLGFYFMLKMVRREKKISEMKNDFINNLTHEFKTPIFSINLASKALRKLPLNEHAENVHSYTNIIDNESARLKNQVDNILQLSLLNSGHFELDKKTTDIHGQLQKIADHFKLILKEKNGTIEFDFRARKHIIQADSEHLKNVWYNLLDNAVKYSPEQPTIHISTANMDKNTIEINFKDRGLGIDRNTQKFIFDRFYRVSTGNLHKIKGFGIGLSYVKSIINKHKGSITVHSKKNKGTHFKIWLPIK